VRTLADENNWNRSELDFEIELVDDLENVPLLRHPHPDTNRVIAHR
jgi:hypothetical protein